MSDINEVFSDDDFFAETTTKKEVSDKTPKPKWIPFADGEYFGHIAKVTTREVDTHKKQHRALVYNFEVRVADENCTNNYTYPWGNTTYNTGGEEYIGKTIRARGVFRYLVPKDGDTFTANAEGNKSFTYFCDALQIEMPTKTKTINGEEVVVKSLPMLEESDLLGKPVVAVVGEGNKYTNKNGKEVTPKEVKFVKVWRDGHTKEITSDADIPF